MVNVTKQSWRAEWFRSADIRRSAGRCATKNARERRRELRSAVDSTIAENQKEFEARSKARQRRITTNLSTITKQNKEEPSGDNEADLFTFIIHLFVYIGISGIISILAFNEALAGHWTAIFLVPLPAVVLGVLKLFE